MPVDPHDIGSGPFFFDSRRSPVYAKGGMVAASQPLAVSAGIDVLNKGGHAVDAAIAVAAVLGVTEPASTGLGGDGFALVYDARTKQVSGYNGTGRSPAALTKGLLQQKGMDELPERHPLTVTVPGAFSLWCLLMDDFGRLSMGDVLEAAVRHAHDGFPLAPISAELWRSAVDVLRRSHGGGTLLYNGHAPAPGNIVRNEALGGTLAALASTGGTQQAYDYFYNGPVSSAMASVMAEAGGVLSEDDLSAHFALRQAPISTSHQGVKIFECAPNGQGMAALIAFNILETLGVPVDDGPLGTERLHLMIEAMRLAFADVRRYVADPDCMKLDYELLLSKDYAAARARLVDPLRAGEPAFGTPMASSDTVQFCVVDGEGNAVSMVNSVYMSFGSGIVAPELGFPLQNRGHNFSMEPGHPNCLGPSKRTYHTIIPGMAVHDDDGSLFGPFGVMGGFMQPQGHVQILSAMLHDGLDPQAALNLPRFCLPDGLPGNPVALEEGMPDKAIKDLRHMGHRVATVRGYDRSLFGRGQVILRDKDTGWLLGGSDGRADGMAFGLGEAPSKE